MKRIAVFLSVLGFSFMPLAASAHQHATFKIGGTQYDFVIGSLNEPIVVDDKTGVDFRVTSGGHMMKADDGDMEPMGGTPAEGLEKNLKVELIAGDKKKTLDLSPAYNTPGSYKAAFYPTVATTLSYRFFGTLNNTPIDVTFTCRAEGATAVDEGEKEISAGVTQLMKGGGFGCPAVKESLGFPEQSAAIGDLARGTAHARILAQIALALAALGLGSIGANRFRKKQ